MSVATLVLDHPSVLKEIANGEGLSLSQAAKRYPGARGKPCAASTLWRWASEGVKTPDGKLVKLEVARLGCRWYTSPQALVRFLERQNGVSEQTVAKQATRRKKQRQRQIEAAEQTLEAAGI